MFGSELFSVGINVWTDGKWSNDFTNSWRASVTYSDYSHCNHEGIHGSFGTKYVNKLSFAVDTIIKDCATFSIELRTAFGDNKPFLIYKDKDEFPPPENILEILKKEAKRVGFKVAEDSI